MLQHSVVADTDAGHHATSQRVPPLDPEPDLEWPWFMMRWNPVVLNHARYHGYAVLWSGGRGMLASSAATPGNTTADRRRQAGQLTARLTEIVSLRSRNQLPPKKERLLAQPATLFAVGMFVQPELVRERDEA